PILPKITRIENRAVRRHLLEIRHSSLYTPRDFDISPYFEVVKPTLIKGFNYKKMHWADLPLPPERMPEDRDEVELEEANLAQEASLVPRDDEAMARPRTRRKMRVG